MIPVDDVLAALTRADRPMTAVEIARACRCDLPHETARRRVREAVELLRQMGQRICADSIHGYWLEAKAGQFARYLARRRERNVRDLGRVGKARRKADEQPLLFESDATDARHVEALRR